ncbi:MAG: tyrosine-type recombinase/integrase [Armatimonadota bacterium]
MNLRVLAEWYFADCTAKNLQPRTVDFYRLKIRYLLDAAGDRPADAITTKHLRMLIEHYRQKRGWSVGTTNHTITSWKVFFHFLEREEILTTNPARRLDKLKGEQRIPEPFTPDEIQRLLQATSTGFAGIRDTAMILVLLDTGVRLSELLGLRLDDVDLGLAQMKVLGKGRKERMLPISPVVRRAFVKYLAHRAALQPDTTALWLCDEGTEFTMWAFVNEIRRLATKGQVLGVHVHRFRHTFASEYLRQGGNPAYLQRLLGHTTPIMTNRYVHLVDADAQQDHQSASPATHILGPHYRGPKGK